jgi:hypothetical protein
MKILPCDPTPIRFLLVEESDSGWGKEGGAEEEIVAEPRVVQASDKGITTCIGRWISVSSDSDASKSMLWFGAVGGSGAGVTY